MSQPDNAESQKNGLDGEGNQNAQLNKMPTITEETGHAESVDAKDNDQGLQNTNQVSGSTDASPIKMATINENQQDELVQILTKGGSNPQKQFVNQFVHPNQRVRTREEIENEVLAELREIDRQYNII